jgi:hypothetical protein
MLREAAVPHLREAPHVFTNGGHAHPGHALVIVRRRPASKSDHLVARYDTLDCLPK